MCRVVAWRSRRHQELWSYILYHEDEDKGGGGIGRTMMVRTACSRSPGMRGTLPATKNKKRTTTNKKNQSCNI